MDTPCFTPVSCRWQASPAGNKILCLQARFEVGMLVSGLDVGGPKPGHLNLEYPVSKPSLVTSFANGKRTARG